MLIGFIGNCEIRSYIFLWEEEKRGERRDRFIFCEIITYWRKTFFDSRENDIFFLYRRVDFGDEKKNCEHEKYS